MEWDGIGGLSRDMYERLYINQRSKKESERVSKRIRGL
jgi:hypothetical protein